MTCITLSLFSEAIKWSMLNFKSCAHIWKCILDISAVCHVQRKLYVISRYSQCLLGFILRWWFRNPKANHLGWFQNPVNNGISTTNLNWWVCRNSGCHQPPIISSRRFRGTFRWSFSQALEALCLNKNDLPNFLWWNLHRIWASPRNSWWHWLNSTDFLTTNQEFPTEFTKFYEDCFVLAPRIRQKIMDTSRWVFPGPVEMRFDDLHSGSVLFLPGWHET